MRIRCPGCESGLKVPDERAGQTGRCPKCGKSVLLVAEEEDEGGIYGVVDPHPSGASAAARASGPAAPEPPEEGPLPRRGERGPRASGTELPRRARDAEEGGSPKKARRKKKKSGKGLLEKLESLKGWQMAALAMGSIAAVGVTLLAAHAILAPMVSAARDAAYSAPPAGKIPDDQWFPFPFGRQGRVLLPRPTETMPVLASTVPLTMAVHQMNPDAFFAVATNQKLLGPQKLELKPEVLLNDFCDGFGIRVRAEGGEELSRQTMRVGKHPAMQMVSRVPAGRGRLVHRAIFANGNVYFLLAGGKGYTPDHPDVRKFLDSFEVIGESPAGDTAPAPAEAASAAVTPAPAAVEETSAQPVAFPAGQREVALTSLKPLGIALAEYEKQNKRLPYQAVTDDQGRHLLSWRVEPSAVFDPAELHASKDVTDGLSRTLIIAETASTVPWTKPEDADVGGEMPQLGTHYAPGFLALAADGRAYTLPAAVDREKLRAVISRAGGEPVEIRELAP